MTIVKRVLSSRRDSVDAGFVSPWIDFEPEVSQGGAVEVVATFARFRLDGAAVELALHLTVLSAPPPGGAGGEGGGEGGDGREGDEGGGEPPPPSPVELILPTEIAFRHVGAESDLGAQPVVGYGMVYDLSSSTGYAGVAVATHSNRFRFVTNAAQWFGAVPPIALAAGDTLSFNLSYEVL